MKFKIPKVTIGIFLFSTVFYLALSSGAPYVHPLSEMHQLGLFRGNLLGVFTYSFTHIGLRHLIANMFVFLALGTVLEQQIDGKHVLGIFLFSGALGGFLYTLVYPTVWVVGASASIVGILVSAVIADFKKTIPLFIASLLLLSGAVLPLTNQGLEALYSRKQQAKSEYVQQAEVLNQTKSELTEEISSLKKKIEADNATEEEKKRYKELLNQTKNISQTITEKKEKVEEKEEETEDISEGMETESMTPVSEVLHLFGGFLALLYVALAERKLFYKFKRDILDFIENIAEFIES